MFPGIHLFCLPLFGPAAQLQPSTGVYRVITITCGCRGIILVIVILAIIFIIIFTIIMFHPC